MVLYNLNGRRGHYDIIDVVPLLAEKLREMYYGLKFSAYIAKKNEIHCSKDRFDYLLFYNIHHRLNTAY